MAEQRYRKPQVEGSIPFTSSNEKRVVSMTARFLLLILLFIKRNDTHLSPQIIYSVTKSLIDLITAIINACKEGRKKGDGNNGKLLLIIRDTHRNENSTEEIVLEVYDNDLIDSEKVKKVIESGINKKFNKK